MSKTITKHKKYLSVIALVLIVALAIFLRIKDLGLSLFFHEEEYSILSTNYILKNLTYFAPFSQPFSPEFPRFIATVGPVPFYIFTLPLIISKNPLSVTFFIAVLNILSVVLCYQFTKRFFNKNISLITTALFATSPQAVAFARKIWTPYLVVPFVVIFYYVLFLAVLRNRPKKLILAFAICTIAIQIGSVGWALLASLIVGIYLCRTNLKIKDLIIGIASFILLYLPQFFLESKSDLIFYKHLINQLATFNFREMISALTTNLKAISYFNSVSKVSYGLEIILFILGLIVIIKRYLLGYILARKEVSQEYLKYFLVLLWTFIPFLLLMLFRHACDPPDHHYSIPMFPSQFVIMAIGLDYMATKIIRNNFSLKPFAFVLVITIVFLQSIGILHCYKQIEKESIVYETWSYGDVPLRYKISIAKYIIQDSANNKLVISNNIHTLVPPAPDYYSLVGYWYLFNIFSKEAVENGIPVKYVDTSIHYVILHRHRSNQYAIDKWLSLNKIGVFKEKITNNLSVIKFTTEEDFRKFKFAFDVKETQYEFYAYDKKFQSLF